MEISKRTEGKIAQAIISELEEKEEEIAIEKRLTDGYKRPTEIMWKSDILIPDIRTSTPNGNTNLYEIEFSHKLNKTKWQLFPFLAKLNCRGFLVVLPETNIGIDEAFLVENSFKNTRLVINLN